jgi:SAM-dependent methyltransferase
MNRPTFNRLHALRMENDEARYRQQDMAPRFATLAGRHENGTAPRAVSAFQLFQTPAPLAVRLVAALNLNRSCRVLEPSAGLGRILDAIAKTGAWDVTAVEVAPECAAELYRQQRPEVRLLQRDFLACTVAELGRFDAVAMNPPFHMRADIRHILHARTFLKPGGKLAALCFDTPTRAKALRHLCATWEPVEAGAFGKEGTSVATVLLTMEGDK